MAKWVKPLSQVASKSAASRNLKDEEVVQALMAQAGVQDKVQKPTFLENVSAAFGAFRWTDDALKALQEGQSFPEAVGNYLVDIPRTLAGVALGKRDWVDPDEGYGVELMKYLGVEEKLPQYLLGTLADIFEPSMAISGTIKGGTKLTELGVSFLDDVAKVGVKNSDEGLKLIAKTFGKEAGESAVKRLAANDDIMSIASDFVQKSGKGLGFVEDVAPGAYLGFSAETGRKIAGGTIPSYIAKLIDSPVTAPFEIGWDVAKKTGLTDTKLVKGLSKGLEKNILDSFVYQKGLKKKGPELAEFGSKISGINTASEYASGSKLRDLEAFFNKLPKEQKQEFFEKGIADYIEIGGGLPQKTTVREFVETLKEAKLIVKSDYDDIIKRLDPVVAQTPFSEVPKLLKQKTAYGTSLLEDQLGYAFKFVPARLNAMSKQAAKWNSLLEEIGYKGNKVIETAKDVQRFRDAIKRSKLDEQSKEFYNRYIADIFEANLNIEGRRTALGLADLGPGYIRRSYNIKSINDLPKDVKKNLISRQERMLPSLADLEVYNEFSPTKLELQTGARGLVNQISYKAGQDQAVKLTYDAYNSLIEQVKMGMMPDFAIKGMGDIPKTWEKTGVPMLDDAGILVNKDTWDIIKDSNKFLLGQTDYNEMFKAFDKMNSWWRGWTTAWTIKLPKGVNLPGLGNEIPLNPAYFVRNWMNNKMSMMLYAGMNPAEIPTRMFQSKKVWNYLSKGVGGEEKIGNYTVKQIGDAFARQGGLGGTNVEDILRSMGEYEGALGAVKGALGGGELAQKIEVSDKIAIFIDQKLKNIGDVKAMDKARFALFDYTQLTDFELEKVKPLFAFYTWNRRNIESLFTTMVKDPKRVKAFDKIFKGFKQLADEQDTDIKEILPDYLQGAYSIITGGGEQVGAIYGFGTNVEAAGELFGRDMKESAQNLFGQLAPNIRIPLELVADFNFFKGKPISEDTSAYSMRNLPENAKKLMGIDSTTFTTDSGKEVTTYKMNPTVKYLVENFRPATSLLKLFNVATDEGLDNEMFLDLLNYVTGIRYQQYDTEYLRRQLENERYKQRMQMLMDEGYVNEYKNYYIPKGD